MDSGPRPNQGLLIHSASDFLDDGAQWYSRRARRKKIAIVSLEATNSPAGPIVGPITVDFTRATLRVGERSFEAETRDAVVRKLSTFQWDFLFYWILHFSFIELAIELFLFFAGTLFNWSLRRRLAAILDRPVTLEPGKKLAGLIAFMKVPAPEGGELALPWKTGDGKAGTATCFLPRGRK